MVRHPWIAIVGAAVVLTPLIIPIFSLELGQEDISVTPTSTTERRAYDLVTAGLGVGYNGPLLVATTLEPAAAPSAKYEQQYTKATALKQQTGEGAEVAHGRQARDWSVNKTKLESSEATLQSEADELQAQESELLQQQTILEAASG